jgi:hypothetical protein
MRLTRIAKAFDDPDYIFELKHDGFRAIAYIEAGGQRRDFQRKTFRQTGTSFENSPGEEVMEKKRQIKRGDSVVIRLPVGQIVEVTVRAVIEDTDGVHLQVDWGHDQTALIHERDVVRE